MSPSRPFKLINFGYCTHIEDETGLVPWRGCQRFILVIDVECILNLKIQAWVEFRIVDDIWAHHIERLISISMA